MDKPLKHTVSIIMKNEEGKTLFALRSPNKTSYPLTWSLPSAYVIEGETFEDTCMRIGRTKLGVELKVISVINEGHGVKDRGDHKIFMHDYEARVVSGVPKVVSDDYVEMKWEVPEVQFKSMKEMGDCCRLYKEYLEK